MSCCAPARDTSRVGAYPCGVTLPVTQGRTPAAPTSPHKQRRRRPPNWKEQQKRKAWGRFWGNANKGAMSR